MPLRRFPLINKALQTPVWLRHLSKWLCLAVFLAGCDRQSADAQFETYQDRLANVLDISPQAPDDFSFPPFPPTRDLTLPVEDIRINLLDAYELRKCGLFNLIAERNSILGKVQDKTRQLRYELLFLNGLQHCLTVLPKDAELYNTLKDYQEQKQRLLPIYLWNMLTTGEEWRQQLTLHHRAFAPQKLYGFYEALNAYTYTQHLAERIKVTPATAQSPTQTITQTTSSSAPATTAAATQAVSTAQIDRLLSYQEKLHPYHYAGQLFYSIEHATHWLNTITSMLTEQEKTIPCGENRNQQKATYLNNVFHKHFVTTLQPYLAQLDSQYQQIQPYLQSLLQPPRPLDSPAFTQYYQYYLAGTQHQAFRDATLSHVAFWQRTFKRCKIRVGSR